MRTDDPERVRRVVALALERLPLEEIASGPAEELGLGAEWRHHSALDALLQGLGPHPGTGWPLVRAALRSPVTRNRNGAVQVLAEWGRERWPAGAEEALSRALEEEPNEGARERMRGLLAGEPPES